MIRRPLLCLAVLGLALGCATVPAGAQDPQIDPGSPAGTEYQLPTDRARQEASGGGSSTDDGSAGSEAAGNAPLFGEGVAEKRTSFAQNPGMDSDPATTVQVEADQGTRTPEMVRAQAPSPDGDGGGLVAIAGGAGGVLLLGALAGLALRRRTMRP